MFSQYGWQTARSLIRSIGGFPHDDFPFNFNQLKLYRNRNPKKMDETELCEVSSQINGAKILFSTDDFFGVAENLLRETEPNTDTIEVTSKLPDAWLTRRIRKKTRHFVLIQLAKRADIYFICLDTTSLIGNVPLEFSVQGSKLCLIGNDDYQNRSNRAGTYATIDESRNIRHLRSQNWPHLIRQKPLNPDCSTNKKFFMVTSLQGQAIGCSVLRLNIFPDGGISRLRVYGKVWTPLPTQALGFVWVHNDLISKVYGGNCIAYSSCCNNAHPNNLIKPSESISIKDGWQTARSFIRSTAGFSDNADISDFNKIVGEEWAIFQLGCSGKIVNIILDTTCCEGNSPYVVQVQGLREHIKINDVTDINNKPWQNIVPYTLVNERSCQIIPSQNDNLKMAYVKLSIKPDGCVSRFRVFGDNS